MYGYQSGQTAIEQYRKQQRREEEYWQDCREVQKEGAKTEIRVNAKLHLNEMKMRRKEEEEERKRGIFEQVAITENGQIIVATQNLQIQAADRKFTNMYMPEMYALRRNGDMMVAAYMLTCKVAGEEKAVFLDSQKVGSGTYVLKKMASEGIGIMSATAKAKEYIRQLVAILLGRSVPEIVIPDGQGWMKREDGKFQFVGEDDWTWEKLGKRI